MALFALIFGIWFYLFTREFVNSFFAADERWRLPMERQRIHYPPDTRIRGNISLFLMAPDQHALIAEEKRNGTMELLLTSPIRIFSIIWQVAGSNAPLSLPPRMVTA